MIQSMLAIWSLVPLPFPNPTCTSSLKDFEQPYLVRCKKVLQLYSSLNILWHCPPLGLEWQLTFSSPVGIAVFQIYWHIECSTLTAPSFRIWNSSAGIPSFPLVLFTVIPPKAHLSSYSKMSGYGWVITPSWLSGSLRSFVLYFCVFLPPLLNLFCFC